MNFFSRRSDAILAFTGLAGLALFATLYHRAYPHASVKLSLSRTEALERARAVAESLGAPVGELEQAAQFGGNTTELLFLQRTLGLEEASRWASEEVPIWSWNARWFKPQEKEEWRVGLGVDGKLVLLEHLLEDAAPGDSLSQDSARSLAEDFVRGLGWNLEEFDLVESSSQKRERRTDHRFTWEKRGSTIDWQSDGASGGTGAVRLAVSVLGGAVGSYRHFLKVPEDFERKLQSEASVGTVIALASLGLTFLLVLGALAVCVVRSKAGLVQWRMALVLAGVIAAVTVIDALISLPTFKYAYPTEIPWGAYLGIGIAGVVFAALLYAAEVTFTTAAGESLGRELLPQALRGLKELARGKLFEPEAAAAVLRGYALGFGLLGYLTVFYVAAQRWLGAWFPAEGPYSEIFNQYLPFLAPLTVGVIAGISEEITYRLFGISLAKRYLKSTALALLVPAAIWAFAHSNYPVFPVYVRGIELTVAGVLFGLALLRWGIVACIAAHFVINAVLTGVPLLTSGHGGYFLSGLLVIGAALIPAVAGLAIARRASL
ncbi:MAG: hypothetical protein KatS3mg081_1457 [Gemmatimonadales bacterium]|nr:MAG: hypothetical protein KatS3mg081_1457 [Gemmatimonadales bacterium]